MCGGRVYKRDGGQAFHPESDAQLDWRSRHNQTGGRC
jgi:hypothetical protein